MFTFRKGECKISKENVFGTVGRSQETVGTCCLHSFDTGRSF